MKAEVQAVIGLQDTAIEDTLLQGWLNDGVVDVLLRTQCYVTDATMTETSGTGDYTLDPGILIARSLRWTSTGGSSSYPARVANEEIERLRSAASTVSTTYPAAAYAVIGANVLKVYPTPGAADTITIFYVPRPTAMSDVADDPSSEDFGGIPAEYHKAVVLYAEWKAADYRDDQSSAQGERYRQTYEDEVKRIRKYVTLHGGRLGKAVVHPSRRRTGSARDRDPGW
jgi:hypothetical protein